MSLSLVKGHGKELSQTRGASTRTHAEHWARRPRRKLEQNPAARAAPLTPGGEYASLSCDLSCAERDFCEERG